MPDHFAASWASRLGARRGSRRTEKFHLFAQAQGKAFLLYLFVIIYVMS